MACKDCIIAIILIIAMAASGGVYVVKVQKQHGIFMEKLSYLESEIKELKKMVPRATADRWSGGMMNTYHKDLMAFLSGDGPEPNLEVIRRTTPILTRPSSP